MVEFVDGGERGRERRALLISEEPLFLAGLRSVVDSGNREWSFLEAENFSSSVEVLRGSGVDLELIVYCVGEAHISEREAIRVLRDSCPQAKILVLAPEGDTVFAERSLREGAHGFLFKTVSPTDLLDGLRRLMRGELVVAPRLAYLLLTRVLQAPNHSELALGDLSVREKEVFELVGNGQCTREIAGLLHISVKTVETHQSRIKKKLNLANSTEFVHGATQWVTGLRLGRADGHVPQEPLGASPS